MSTVMVTAVGGGGVGEQILKALRLSNQEYRIIGADVTKNSKGFFDVNESVILPLANDPNYFKALVQICIEEKVDALFFGSEAEMKTIGPQRELFLEQTGGLFLSLCPQAVQELCFNKLETAQWLNDNGFATPRTEIVTDMSSAIETDIAYPYIVKPHLDSGGSANVFLVQDDDERDLFCRYMLKAYESFIIQEYISTPESEYTVGVLFDMEGRLVNSIGVKKNITGGMSNRLKVANRTKRSELGNVLAISSGISQGEIGRFENITRQCEEIGLKLGCTGAVNIQCRVVDGKVYTFEINPRLSGTTSLRALVGYNEPEVLLNKHFYGIDTPFRFDYQEGLIVRGLTEHFIPN